MPDYFSFYCDLDKKLPPSQRTALTVAYDGEHVIFNFSEKSTDGGREVYLTPEAATYLTGIILELIGTAEDEGSAEDAAADDVEGDVATVEEEPAAVPPSGPPLWLPVTALIVAGVSLVAEVVHLAV